MTTALSTPPAAYRHGPAYSTATTRTPPAYCATACTGNAPGLNPWRRRATTASTWARCTPFPTTPRPGFTNALCARTRTATTKAAGLPTNGTRPWWPVRRSNLRASATVNCRTTKIAWAPTNGLCLPSRTPTFSWGTWPTGGCRRDPNRSRSSCRSVFWARTPPMTRWPATQSTIWTTPACPCQTHSLATWMTCPLS